MIGPANGDAADTLGWRRPYRHTHAAPHDAFLMANPVPFHDELLWVGKLLGCTRGGCASELCSLFNLVGSQ